MGKSDLYVTELGFGCMSIGTEERAARRIIEAALEEGINYFDTADLYNVGENEKIVGRALREVREQGHYCHQGWQPLESGTDRLVLGPVKILYKRSSENEPKKAGDRLY